MLVTGQIVDRYIVEEPLGEGGMAIVYRVRHDTLNSLHALKVLTVDGERVKERLLAEGRAQGQLLHPNALNVTDIVDIDGAPGLVMEYVAGGTLEDWLDRERPDREDRLEAFRKICDCLAAAHEKGWIHRDLKPSNVLMDDVAGTWVPKVADFGLVKALETPLGKARTRKGIAMGTPGFMATEQFTDAANVTQTADVFSLGCILIWLITETIPFDGETPVQVYRNVAANSHVGLKPTDPLFPLTERCLHPDPQQRPSNARELLGEFEQVVGSHRHVDFGDVTRTPAPVARTKPVEPRSKPKPKAPAPTLSPGRSCLSWLGCSGLLVGAMVLAVSLILGAVFVPRALSRNAQICNLNGEGSFGFINSYPTEARPRSMIRLVEEVQVSKIVGGREELRCKLPAGTRIRLEKVKNNRTWLLYDARNQLPRRLRLIRVIAGEPAN